MDGSTDGNRSLADLLKHPSKLRHHNQSPASSLAVPDTEGDRSGFRKSVELFRDRSRRNSEDTGRRRNSVQPNGRRLSKLLPHNIKRKKSPRPGDAVSLDSQNSAHGSGSGAGYDSNPLTHMQSDGGLGITAGNPSEDSLGRRPSSITSSLLTDDEVIESPLRPTIEARPSHAAYLTLSSPLIAAGTQGTAPQSVTEIDENETLPVQATAPSTAISTPISTQTTKPSSIARKQIPLVQVDVPLRDPVQPSSVRPASSGTLPETFVTPPTPVIRQGTTNSEGDQANAPDTTNESLPHRAETFPRTPTEHNVIHRRVKSDTTRQPAFLNPLSPAIEETKTPGGGFAPPANGFFSTVFTATQNAVNQLSTSFANANTSSQIHQRNQSGSGSAGGEEVLLNSGTQATMEKPLPSPPSVPAIATLGSGNLSLSHLGIADANSDAKSISSSGSIKGRARRSPSIMQRGNFPDRSEESLAADAVSAAYVEKPAKSVLLPTDGTSERRRSVGSTVGSLNDVTPPASVANGVEDSGNKRSNSVRSRLSDRRRRHRNSSTATGSAIAAALAASHAAIANPAAKSKPTGFALASSKRNKDFHAIFKSVPEDDFLIEDYSAALHRDILLQGRLYVSEKNICFSSNILGWVTNLVINIDELVAMDKRMTAVIFPNAIEISTLQAKHTFASLINRELTYDTMLGVWKAKHHNVKSTEHGHSIGGDGEGEKAAQGGSGETSEDESDEYYDEDGDESGSFIGSEAPSESPEMVNKAGSKLSIPPTGSSGTTSPNKAAESPDPIAATAALGDYPGPTTHSPTECTDQSSHYEKELIDIAIPAPLGKVYSMFFGPQSGTVMRKFFLDEQKCTDLLMDDDKKGLGEDQKSFTYSYTKPLYAALGPKQCKCIVTQTLDFFDLEKAVSVTCTTATPDVPSGNVFLTKTKYCLMWGPDNSTRIIGNCMIEWSGKSWLKGPIEKGANEGQLQHCKDLFAFFKTQISARPSKSGGKGKHKGTRRKRSSDEHDQAASVEKSTTSSSAATTKLTRASFGPVGEVLGTIGDMLGPLSNTTIVLAVLLLFVSTLWLRQGRRTSEPQSPSHGHAGPYVTNPRLAAQRLAAYDQLWQEEENDLWTWLEERVGLDKLTTSSSAADESNIAAPSWQSRTTSSAEEAMSERQVDDAIRVTEEKLLQLKRMVEKKRSAEAKKSG